MLDLTDARAITVRQPWAFAIRPDGKTIENRTQAWTHRGPLLIHAGTVWSQRGQRDPLVVDVVRRLAPELLIAPQPVGFGRATPAMVQPHSLPEGVIVAVADLVDVHHEEGGCCAPWGETFYDELAVGGTMRRRTNIVHLLLEQITELDDPIPARGRQGLWRPDAALIDEVNRSLHAQAA